MAPLEGNNSKRMIEQLLHERRLDFDDSSLARDLFGPNNSHVELLAAGLGVNIETKSATALLRAKNDEDLDLAAKALIQLYGQLKKGRQIFPEDVDFAVRLLDKEPGANLSQIFDRKIFASTPRKIVAPRTPNQRKYLQAMRERDMVFGIGPAGTGKTYLAVAMAVRAFQDREVRKIILTRPAVEAGEKLGFLPGDMAEKINPYLRPLYDALYDMFDSRRVRDMLDSGSIEIAPLAFMRGRTLNDSFIILDEAQNTSPEQMKMFLTRLGASSKAVITGDITQIDLPAGSASGLVEAARILAGIKEIEIIFFGENDVIRHPLVAKIVHAYENQSKTPARGRRL